jgi:hypothetical protein
MTSPPAQMMRQRIICPRRPTRSTSRRGGQLARIMMRRSRFGVNESATDSDFIFLTLGYASAAANIYGDNQVGHSAVHLTESQRAIAK